MRVWVFTISWNENPMMKFFLRHYSTFAEKIIVWDENSTDGTQDIIRSCPQAELRHWPHQGLDDDKFIFAVNNWYREAVGKADWVMWPDVDEILYHPCPVQVLEANASYDVLPGMGYAMVSNEPIPTGDGQIYDYVKTGVPQQNYNKWIIWKPHVQILHTHGRHDVPKCQGRVSGEMDFKLLHYHYFSPEYTASRNQRNYNRACNKRFAWNYAPGMNIRGTPAWVKEQLDSGNVVPVV